MQGHTILGINLVSCTWMYISWSTVLKKIIFTSDYVFMFVVGPGGSGETRLIFSMLASETFSPSFHKTFYFYKKYQLLFDEMAKEQNIEFVLCFDFNMIWKLEHCLLVFDDSCEGP